VVKVNIILWDIKLFEFNYIESEVDKTLEIMVTMASSLLPALTLSLIRFTLEISGVYFRLQKGQFRKIPYKNLTLI